MKLTMVILALWCWFALSTRLYRDGSIRLLDLPTLVILLLGGLNLGVIGIFNFNAATWLLGSYHSILYMLVGASAIWQLCRQRYA